MREWLTFNKGRFGICQGHLLCLQEAVIHSRFLRPDGRIIGVCSEHYNEIKASL